MPLHVREAWSCGHRQWTSLWHSSDRTKINLGDRSARACDTEFSLLLPLESALPHMGRLPRFRGSDRTCESPARLRCAPELEPPSPPRSTA